MKDNLHLNWTLRGASLDEKSIEFCLTQLKLDEVKLSQDNFAGTAIYEEVIGALLFAKTLVEENSDLKEYISKLEEGDYSPPP